MLLKSMSPVSFYFLHVAAKRFCIPYVAGIPFLSDVPLSISGDREGLTPEFWGQEVNMLRGDEGGGEKR